MPPAIPLDNGTPAIAITQSFEIRNYDETTFQYTPNISIFTRDSPTDVSISVTSADGSLNDITDEHHLQLIRHTYIITYEGNTYRLDPLQDGENNFLRIVMFHRVRKEHVSTDICVFGGPVLDVTVTANWPAGWAFDDASMIASTVSKTSTSGRLTYKKGFLTGEHVRVVWSKP